MKHGGGDTLEDVLAARHEEAQRRHRTAEATQAWSKIKWRDAPTPADVKYLKKEDGTTTTEREKDVEGARDTEDIGGAYKRVLTAHGPNTQCLRGRGVSFGQQCLQRESDVISEVRSPSSERDTERATENAGKHEAPCVVELPKLATFDRDRFSFSESRTQFAPDQLNTQHAALPGPAPG